MEQRGRGAAVAPRGGKVQRRVVVAAAAVDRRAALHEQRHELGVPFDRDVVQRRQAWTREGDGTFFHRLPTVNTP